MNFRTVSQDDLNEHPGLNKKVGDTITAAEDYQLSQGKKLKVVKAQPKAEVKIKKLSRFGGFASKK